MEIQVGHFVELMGVENAGLDITGKRGTVKELCRGGIVSVAIDGSADVVSESFEVTVRSLRAEPPKQRLECNHEDEGTEGAPWTDSRVNSHTRENGVSNT